MPTRRILLWVLGGAIGVGVRTDTRPHRNARTGTDLPTSATLSDAVYPSSGRYPSGDLYLRG